MFGKKKETSAAPKISRDFIMVRVESLEQAHDRTSREVNKLRDQLESAKRRIFSLELLQKGVTDGPGVYDPEQFSTNAPQIDHKAHLTALDNPPDPIVLPAPAEVEPAVVELEEEEPDPVFESTVLGEPPAVDPHFHYGYEYHRTCEEFDKLVCTGRHGIWAKPITREENKAVSAFARAMKEHLKREMVLDVMSTPEKVNQDLQTAIGNASRPFEQDLTKQRQNGRPLGR